MMACRSKLAAAAAALLLASLGRAADLPTRTVLPDGLELVVLPDAAARTASLRCVVRAGSTSDLPGKEGLAHLVEHLLLRARGADGLDVVEAARAAGAQLNAYTSRDATIYVLDAPRETFRPLADRLLRAITTPGPRPVDVDRELAVVERESEYGRDATGVVEDALFRSRGVQGTVIGSDLSRSRITRDDVVQFHQGAYASAATTVVMAGAVTSEEASALLRAAWLLPPPASSELRRPPPEAEPELPVDEKIRAPYVALVSGYRIDAADRRLCRPLAELLEQRFAVATSRRALVRSVEVACVTVRGAELLLAFAYTRNLDANDLPELMDDVFAGAATRPVSREERRAVELRMSRRAEAVEADPARLAGEVALTAARSRPGGSTPLPERSAGPFPGERIRALARRSFVPARRVRVLLSPFEG